MTFANMVRIPITTPVMAGVMEQIGIRMDFAKGSEIFGQDEDTDLLHSVVKGAVRTTRLLRDGRRQIGDFYFDGDLVGVETGAVHRFSAEALADCSIRVARRSACRMAYRAGAFDGALLEATQRELERTQNHLLALEHKSACERVASFLLAFAHRKRADFLSLPMGRQDIADYLDLTIETVSRMVSHLQSLQVVEFKGSREFRVIRRDLLEQLAA